MSNNRISRIISAAVWGIVTALGMHSYHAKEVQIGREAFLAKEAARYDHQISHPDSIIVEIIVGLLMLGTLFAAYELAAWAISKVLNRANADDSNN